MLVCVQDWAVAADVNTMSISWHVPKVEELVFVDKLLSEFLQPAFDELGAFVDGKSTDRYICYCFCFVIIASSYSNSVRITNVSSVLHVIHN